MIENCINNLYSCCMALQPYFLCITNNIYFWYINNIVLNTNFGYKGVSFNTTVNDIENNLNFRNIGVSLNTTVNEIENNLNTKNIFEFNEILNELENLVIDSDNDDDNRQILESDLIFNSEDESNNSDNESNISDIENKVQKIILESDSESNEDQDISDLDTEIINIGNTNYKLKSIESDYGDFIDVTVHNKDI